MKVILNAEQIERALGQVADQIAGAQPLRQAGQTSSDNGLAIIGIRSRGEILARRR